MELPNKYNALIEVSVSRILVSINPSREAKVIGHSCRESVCCPTRSWGCTYKTILLHREGSVAMLSGPLRRILRADLQSVDRGREEY
jgi:hypothetical protein